MRPPELSSILSSTTLVDLGIALATIRCREQMNEFIADRLCKFSNISIVSIGICDATESWWKIWLYFDVGTSGMESAAIDALAEQAYRLNKKYPFNDGFFDQTYSGDKVRIWEINKPRGDGYIPSFVQPLPAHGMLIGLPLYAVLQKVGCLFLVVDESQPWILENTNALMQLASMVAASVSNIIANEKARDRIQEMTVLNRLAKQLARVRKKGDLARAVLEGMGDILPLYDILIGLNNADKQTCQIVSVKLSSIITSSPDYLLMNEGKYPIEDGILKDVSSSSIPLIYDLPMTGRRNRVPRYIVACCDAGIRQVVFIPLADEHGHIGFAVFFAIPFRRFKDSQHRLIEEVSSMLSDAVKSILVEWQLCKRMEEMHQSQQRLEVERTYLREEIHIEYNRNELLGSGPAMRDVFSKIEQVAASQTTVLIYGETGTGKELIARAIHHLSPRRDKMMIKVNCAAMPANLIESELFGHEKGSFTGATERRIGKFELAHNGTLFLDEIGELPLELQPKLLRVLQENEIERIGGRSVQRVNVRILAATNRDLYREVLNGNFRSDLYYRLYVFPIPVPALRERKEDIPGLVKHFLHKYAKQLNKPSQSIGGNVIRRLMAYDWPGNVRELEHLIERSILQSTGPAITELSLPLPKTAGRYTSGDHPIKTIDEMEREYILRVLQLTHGKVSGRGGAAEMLKIAPTTLTSKMLRLGIKRGFEIKK
jgi:transcriptional regulator with GAF, ATPase, and Fis domain